MPIHIPRRPHPYQAEMAMIIKEDRGGGTVNLNYFGIPFLLEVEESTDFLNRKTRKPV